MRTAAATFAESTRAGVLAGVRRLLTLNACIWLNWQIGAPVKRSLIAYDH
jgi:hypothetical protein